MDIVKLVCDKKKIEGIEPENILSAIAEYKMGLINPTEWKLQSVSVDKGITLVNEATYDIKTISCVLNYFDLGNKSCPAVKGYFHLRTSDDCANCINSTLVDYMSGRIKKKNNNKK